jgi:ketosteroid isomerase-like protein
MAREDLEVARRAFEAFNERDVDLFVSLWDPDCEFLPFRAQLEGITYRGREGVRRFVSDMDDDWSRFRIDPLELHELNDRVVAIGRIRALGRGSGTSIDSVGGFVLELRRGLILRVTSHSEPGAAMRAAEGEQAKGAGGRT